MSHQQIDDFLGEKKSTNYRFEKGEIMLQVFKFLDITEELTDAGIEFIALKGPLLSHRIYNDSTYRCYNDFDFLIGIPSLENTIEVLKKNGFQTIIYDFPEDECRRKILHKHMNEIHLFNKDTNIGIDLHWQLFSGGRFINEKTLNQVIASNQTIITFQQRQYKVFSIEFELLYLIIHGGLHSWRRLKWLTDIRDILLSLDFDEEVFQSLVKKLNAHRLVAVCNELLKIYFPGTRLLPCSHAPSKNLLNFALYSINMEKDEQKQSVTEYLKTLWSNSQAFPGPGYKISLLKQQFFATDLAASKWIPCSTLLYYLFSPFYKIIRGFR